ncbi:MAG: hypothetical protein ABIP39_16390 [Polyangiaceae bacterium]
MRLSKTRALAAIGSLLLASSGCAAPAKLTELVVRGDSREISTRPKGAPPSSPDKPPVLFLAFDGAII